MPERFQIAVPERASCQLIDEGRTMEIVLGPQCQPMYFKRIESRAAAFDETSLLTTLRGEIDEFVTLGVVPLLGRTPKLSIEPVPFEKAFCMQAVLQVNPIQWWVIRTAGMLGSRAVYLMHWVGEKTQVPEIAAMMTSFSILEKNMGDLHE